VYFALRRKNMKRLVIVVATLTVVLAVAAISRTQATPDFSSGPPMFQNCARYMPNHRSNYLCSPGDSKDPTSELETNCFDDYYAALVLSACYQANLQCLENPSQCSSNPTDSSPSSK
jgi:hypothetical protein